MNKCPRNIDCMECPSEYTSLEDEDGFVWFYECKVCKGTFNENKFTYPVLHTKDTQSKWWEFWK